jgi:hypothetical protein
MDRYYESTQPQHLHGSLAANRLTSRSQALLWNCAPWHPSETKQHDWQSPAERLNQHRDHENWLQNLLVSASCGGYYYRQISHDQSRSGNNEATHAFARTAAARSAFQYCYRKTNRLFSFGA